MNQLTPNKINSQTNNKIKWQLPTNYEFTVNYHRQTGTTNTNLRYANKNYCTLRREEKSARAGRCEELEPNDASY